jgi:hypothetical protein
MVLCKPHIQDLTMTLSITNILFLLAEIILTQHYLPACSAKQLDHHGLLSLYTLPLLY